MDWVLEDRYESPLSIDTNKVPVVLRLTSQLAFWWRQSHKNRIFQILAEIFADFQIFAKNLKESAILFLFFVFFFWLWKEMTIITKEVSRA